MVFVLTGHKGRLGQEIIKQAGDKFKFIGIDTDSCDISNRFELIEVFNDIYTKEQNIDMVIHAAAFTAVDRAQNEKEVCYRTNVNGTKNVVDCCRKFGLPIMYISTDYIFEGKKGNYKEEDTPAPFNYYGLTKLLGEIIVRQYTNKNLVVRTSFKPKVWPYESAYDDVYTSADYMDVIVKELMLLLEYHQELYKNHKTFRNPEMIFHIATEKKSVYDLAKRCNPKVNNISKSSVNFPLPDDCSMNTEKWKAFKEYVKKLYPDRFCKEPKKQRGISSVQSGDKVSQLQV